MTKPKRNLERRETTVREFRTITSSHRDKKLGYSLGGIEGQTGDLNKLLESNEIALKRKLAAALEIKKMEATGMFTPEDIKQEKIKVGLLQESTVSTTTTSTNDVINMIMMQIANEQDPDRQLELTKTLSNLQMMSDMKNSGNQNNSAIMTLVQNQNRNQTPRKSTFEEEMTKLMMKKLMDEPKSELDNLGKLKTLMDGVQSLMPQSNPIQEMRDNLKMFQEMGIAVSPGGSLEEKRLELEGKKIDKQFALDERKVVAEEERNKSLAGIGGDILSSLVSAGASSMGGDKDSSSTVPNPTQKTIENSMQAVCANGSCGAKIIVPDIKQSRDVKCVKCDAKYQYKADEQKLYMYQGEQ